MHTRTSIGGTSDEGYAIARRNRPGEQWTSGLQRLTRSLKGQTPIVSDRLGLEFLNAERQDILKRNRASWHVHLRKPPRANLYLGAHVQMERTNPAYANGVPMERQELATILLPQLDEVGRTDSRSTVRLLHEREMLGERQRQRRVPTQRDGIAVTEDDGARLRRGKMQSATDHVAPNHARQRLRGPGAVALGRLRSTTVRQGATTSPHA